jgi:magnesium chelatase family protein
MDRIDIQMEVPAVSYEDLASEKRGESSSMIRERVLRAREIQQKRFSGRHIYCNAQMGAKEIREYCHLTSENRAFLEKMANKFSLSARAYHRIIKISRTIADLEGASHIALEHLAEAVQYRSLDRGGNI